MEFPEDLEFSQMLVELIPHLPKAQILIQNISEELARGSIVNWENFVLLIIELREQQKIQICGLESDGNLDYIEKFIFSVLTVFDTHKCSDVSVIADVLEILCIIKCSIPELYKEFKMGIPVNENNGEGYISVFKKTFVSSYNDIPSLATPLKEKYGSKIEKYWNWIKTAIICREADILKAIISFGATVIVPLDVPFEHKKVYVNMLLLFMLQRSSLPKAKYNSYECRFMQNFKSEFNECSRKRFLFIHMVLDTFLRSDIVCPTDKYGCNPNNEYVKCARILVACTPEPFITYEEIESSITKLCVGINISNDRVQKFLAVYEKHFPECRADSTPRSLEHLSRFQVRENLRTARSFPHGVESLCVPEKIQDYIRFKDILV